jgi:hypothetical protein
MGVAIVGAMALGVSALAGPRGADEAVRGTVKGGTDVTRLVTGDPAQINAVVAGSTPATLILAMNPVQPPAGKCASGACNSGSAIGAACANDAACAAMPAYPAGVSISGNELSANAGGFRMWCNAQLSAWGPGDGLPYCQAYQIVIDPTGYADSDAPGDQPDILPAGWSSLAAADGIPCGSAAPCQTAFGERWAKCGGNAGFCDPGYLDGGSGTGNANSYCRAPEACAASGVAIGSPSFNFFAVSDAPPPNSGTLDTGIVYYGGTLVLDIPAGAKGTYTINLDQSATFAARPDPSGPQDIPSAAETGFVVNIRTGQCCFGLGTPGAGCIDGVIASECGDDEPPPTNFTPGKTCQDSCACTANSQCEESPDDECTIDTCNAATGQCIRSFVAGFDPAKPGGTQCCDKATGALTAKDDGDACTCDSCPEEGNRGTARHVACPNPCDDGNSCTVGDVCDGVRTEQAGGCTGTDVNSIPCLSATECPLDPTGAPYACVDGSCFCTLTPKVTFNLNSPLPKTCEGGFTPGAPCAKDSDCPGSGVCNTIGRDVNCFDEGDKVTALVHIGPAGSPILGGQLQIRYDPTCLAFNSVSCLLPYSTELYRNIDTGAGKIFIACGVDAFGGVAGPLGNIDMLYLNFQMIGECNNCELCFESKNPQNSYLVDDEGQAVNIEGQCKELSENGDLVLNIPDNIKVNSDCDKPAAVVTWDPPSASFSCGDVNLICRGAHQSGHAYSQSEVYNGGLLAQGASSFCCYAWAKDKCEQATGCAGPVNDCPGSPKPDGCWTVEVNDELSMDIHVQLEPPIAGGEQTRCIEFCLYGPCTQAPVCFQEDVTFGGLFNYIGKANGKIKAPKGKWGCITAQDQLHSLRSCDIPDCIDGQLVARFKGDPIYDGNWLVLGNLDAYKKDVEKASQDTIDILDFGMFVLTYGDVYTGPTPGCHDGPNGDINGDGAVDIGDYVFIIRNFLVSSKDCCCGPQAAGEPLALSEVSVDELRQMGLDDLVVADLNADGVVNGDDMEAFSQGVRPTKSHDRKGGKGLRSGR